MATETKIEDTTPPPRPPAGEFAKLRGTGTVVGTQFVELLLPTDNILVTKGARDYKLYRETLRDDQCAATFSDRRLAVTSKEWVVDAASDSPLDVAAADFLRGELERVGFDRITDGMLYARWYGHAVAECMWEPDGDLVRLKEVKVRQRSRFLYGTDGSTWLLSPQGKWERMPERKFWTVNVGADNDDEPFGLGLAHYCYWPVFFKRNNLKFWLVFAEKFGSPTAVGKIPQGKFSDEALKDQILDTLLQFSSEAALVLPDIVEVTLLEAARTGRADYGELYDRMDAALAKVIIGQTASSQGTPGRLGNEQLQSDVRDDLIKADADMVCNSFNDQVARWLTEWNFPGAGVPKVWRKVEPDEDLQAAAETDSAIKALGYTPGLEYIKQRYGDHWEKAEPLNLGAGQPGAFGAQPAAADAAAEFAEFGALTTLRAGKRADQQSIVDAAKYLASRNELVADRVAQILAQGEESGDYAGMQQRLADFAAELPGQRTVEQVRNASLFGRLLAIWRGEQ